MPGWPVHDEPQFWNVISLSIGEAVFGGRGGRGFNPTQAPLILNYIIRWLTPMSSFMIIVARARSFNRALATILIGKRTMSTKTIAVLDHGDLKDGQM
jgi:hypothetical protein